MATSAVERSASFIPNVRAAADGPTRSVDEVLRNVSVARHVVQDFTPFPRSLAWQLSELFWTDAGVDPFIENEVPFVVTSNGRLSEDAAAVVLANCLESGAEGPLVVLELGAGSGLFARYFLDAFQQLCAQRGHDFADRLIYLVSDGSPKTVRQWVDNDLFEPWRGRVIPGVCDAMRPGEFRPAIDTPVPVAPLRAVFCNYALDVLPATIVKRGSAGCEELAIRTSLIEDAAVVGQCTSLGIADIRALAASADPASRAALLPLVSVFQMEAAFLPVGDNPPPYATEAVSLLPEGASRAVVNHGAIHCLGACLTLLAPDGFLLVNDYGPVQPDQVTDSAAIQRFGRTAALGINFPLLDECFESRGCTVLRPEGDVRWPIHSRIIARRPLGATADAFHATFAFDAFLAREAPADEARAQRTAGRNDQALEAYRAALARRIRDWHLLGEVAEFVGLHLRDFASGAELARVAVALNPWYSSWLWNVLGDCLFCQEQYAAAHDAYLRAQRIDARDPRTNLNLAYTLFQRASYEDALHAIMVGLTNDRRGQYRDSLLQKQQQILGAISARWTGEQERMARAIPVPP